ncbi:hypothetical protein IGI04_014943, partial [Brassica rapa subsp. trilocularis]
NHQSTSGNGDQIDETHRLGSNPSISPGLTKSGLRFRLIHFWEARNTAKEGMLSGFRTASHRGAVSLLIFGTFRLLNNFTKCIKSLVHQMKNLGKEHAAFSNIS